MTERTVFTCEQVSDEWFRCRIADRPHGPADERRDYISRKFTCPILRSGTAPSVRNNRITASRQA